MNGYKIKGWERFQHYKDRNPPWIKLHFSLLSSRDWVALSSEGRELAVVLMLVASRGEGMVPNDPEYIQAVGHLKKTPNFGPLVKCGFLEPIGKVDTKEPGKVDTADTPQTPLNTEDSSNTRDRDRAQANACKTLAGASMKSNTLSDNEKELKQNYGEFGHVRLTREEYAKLVSNTYSQNEMDIAIDILDSYIENSAKGRAYKNHYSVLRKHNWVWDRVKRNLSASPGRPMQPSRRVGGNPDFSDTSTDPLVLKAIRDEKELKEQMRGKHGIS